MTKQNTLTEVRMRLVDTGGRTSQELGTGRIVGQIMVYLYLQKEAQSLDSIGEALVLSKASISIAVRQLERLGLVRRVWLKGDRKKYYRSADNIGSGLQEGLLSFLRQKVVFFGIELDTALAMLEGTPPQDNSNTELIFLRQRMNRAKKLQRLLLRLLGNPLVNFLAKTIK
ncbi:MAG: MarR family transcriptional regulator [Candidatus Electrothrix sp. AR3]|nr:MarR family transcriptional regulator [Candidatus Electrothrix sp. AR3]